MKHNIFTPKNIIQSLEYNNKKPAFTLQVLSMEKRESEDDSLCMSALTTYFKISSFLGIMPFHFKQDIKSGNWTVSQSTLRTMMCLVIMWLPWLVKDCLHNVNGWVNLGKTKHRSASSYMLLWHCFLNSARNVVFFRSLVMQSGEILQILNWCQGKLIMNEAPNPREDKNEVKNGKRKWVKRYIILIYCTYLIFVLIQMILAVEPGEKLENPRRTFQKRILRARELLFMSEEVPPRDLSTAGNVVLGILFTYLQFSFLLVNFAGEIFCIGPYPLIMWMVANHFDQFWKRIDDNDQGRSIDDNERVATIVEKYEQIKLFSEMLNKQWAKLNLLWIIEMSVRAIFYGGGRNKESLELVDFVDVAILLIVTLYGVAALLLSADVFVKMGNFKQWLTSRQNWKRFCASNETKSEVERLLAELSDDPIGISSRWVYKCTYGFICQMAALLITVYVVSFEAKT